MLACFIFYTTRAIKVANPGRALVTTIQGLGIIWREEEKESSLLPKRLLDYQQQQHHFHPIAFFFFQTTLCHDQSHLASKLCPYTKINVKILDLAANICKQISSYLSPAPEVHNSSQNIRIQNQYPCFKKELDLTVSFRVSSRLWSAIFTTTNFFTGMCVVLADTRESTFSISYLHITIYYTAV